MSVPPNFMGPEVGNTTIKRPHFGLVSVWSMASPAVFVVSPTAIPPNSCFYPLETVTVLRSAIPHAATVSEIASAIST